MFNITPQYLAVCTSGLGVPRYGYVLIFVRNVTDFYSQQINLTISYANFILTWSFNSIRWYTPDEWVITEYGNLGTSMGGSQESQFNKRNYTYYYVCLGS